jgi:hypothetical protein
MTAADVFGFACVGPDTNPATRIEDALRWTRETGMRISAGFAGPSPAAPCCHTINNSGVIVGISIDATAVVWQNKSADGPQHAHHAETQAGI